MTEVERIGANIAGNAYHDLTAVMEAAAKQLTAVVELMKADGGRVGLVGAGDEARTAMVRQVVNEAIGSVRWFAHELIHCDDSPPRAERYVATEIVKQRLNRVLGVPPETRLTEVYEIGQQAG